MLVALRATNRTPAPQLAPLRGMPWWGWLGGACAAGYVTGTFLLMPQIGAAVTVALTVTGQQLASALIDARGLFRLPPRPFTTARGTGLLLLVAGSLLVQLRTTLPRDVDAEKIEATMTEGVLTVRVPKSEQAKPRRIQITQG